jgi:2'-5' RNA ligase
VAEVRLRVEQLDPGHAHGPGPAPGAPFTQSAVLVPVPEAEPLVGRWRKLHDPKADCGVPAHVTLVVPWVPPGVVRAEHYEALDRIVSSQAAFDYKLDQVRWFGERVLWLAPLPAEPFRELTAKVAAHFGTAPWKGEFDEVVPHLTVGLAGQAGPEALREAAEDVGAKLPLLCRAREVLVMCGEGGRWEVSHRVALAGGAEQ